MEKCRSDHGPPNEVRDSGTQTRNSQGRHIINPMTSYKYIIKVLTNTFCELFSFKVQMAGKYLRTLPTSTGIAQLLNGQDTTEINLVVPQKVNHRITSNFTPRYTAFKELKAGTNSYVNIHSTIAKRWKPKCLLTDEWINNMWYASTNGILFTHKKGMKFQYRLQWDKPWKHCYVKLARH